MKKIDIARYIQRRLGAYSLRRCNALVDDILLLIKQSLAQGEQVKISGFGTFRVRNKSARIGCKPRGTEKIVVPAHNVVSFKPSKKLRQLVNREVS